MKVLKQRSLAYSCSQPDDNTYYTYGTQVAAAVVHKKEEIIIRLNDSASVQDAEMTAIRLAHRGHQWNKRQDYNTHRLLDSGNYI